MKEDNDIYKKRKERLKEIQEKNINPYPQKSFKKTSSKEILEKFSKLKKGEKTNKTATVAGRVMTSRIMGKASFFTIQDQDGRIQIFATKDSVKNYDLMKRLDHGDIIFVKGKVFRTNAGEISIHATSFELLTKSLRPLPDKWSGLKDKEERYRKRYLDLIINPEVREVFKKRDKIIKIIREFMQRKDFLEVETPTLQTIYGGASARPFKTHLNALNTDLFLSISPEIYLKKLIVGGYERVFTICKNFRNEGIDRQHNPEFTMLEFYQAYATYEDLMKFTEELISKLVKEIVGKNKVNFQNKELDFKTPFKRITFRDLVLQKTKIDIDKAKDFKTLKKEIESKKIKLDLKGADHYGALLDRLYKEVCRPSIIQPTFLTHYPTEMIALAKRNPKDKTKINSFQLLVDGAEIVKAYDELNDPQDQESRLEEQQALLRKGDEEAMPMDKDFITALEYGMPPTAGYGLGIDRLTMILTNQPSIRDIILFPFMKPR